MKVLGAGECVGSIVGEGFGTKAGVSEHGEAFGEFADGSGAQFVGLGHGASGVIGGEQVATLQFGASAAMTLLIHCGRDAIFHFDGRIVGKGVAEVLNDIEAVSRYEPRPTR